ncbi:hypothetical protein JXA63_04710 [Candidatus Woesebacteria bacterium]|nr:hypothetical protein [Candidatus Woesebacteria bacterium]
MIEYEKAGCPEFTTLRAANGNYYHQMGNYRLYLGETQLLPVNRSYVADRNGDRNCRYESGSYRKDPLIHERVDNSFSIVSPEQLVQVYGKPYLYLVDNQNVHFLSSSSYQDERVSIHAKDVLDITQSALGQEGLEYKLGIFGSHRVGLEGVDSDIDLVMWTDFASREILIDLVSKGLHQYGYLSSGEQGKDVKYAAKYSRRFDVSDLAGWYLAKKRNRFVDPQGVSVSLQCLNTDYDYNVVGNFFEVANSDWSQEEVDMECEIIDSQASYNFPKYWYLDIGAERIPAVSLSWMHQGMGDDSGEQFGRRYRLRAAMLRTEKGKIAYLRDSNHYIIPQSLL